MTIENQLKAEYQWNPGWDEKSATFEMTIVSNNLHGDYQLANGYGHQKAKQVLKVIVKTLQKSLSFLILSFSMFRFTVLHISLSNLELKLCKQSSLKTLAYSNFLFSFFLSIFPFGFLLLLLFFSLLILSFQFVQTSPFSFIRKNSACFENADT